MLLREARIFAGDPLWRFAVVSGQVGSLADGTPEPDYEAQVRLAYENLEATLAAGGCTFDDVVDVTVFHTVPPDQTAEDSGAWAGIRSRVRRERFPQAPFTNITAIGVNWLAGFDLSHTRSGTGMPLFQMFRRV